MRNAALGLCFSGFMVSALPSRTQAALEYRAKTDADLFRTQALEPPPLANLAQGEGLKLLQHGGAQSLVETEGGLKGWMRNGDIVAMAAAPGQNMALGSQTVTGSGEVNISPDSWGLGAAQFGLLPLDRDFAGDIVEAKDREQLEMRHGEN